MAVQQTESGPKDTVEAPNNNIDSQRISLWITPVVAAVFLIAFVAFPGFRPPMSPNMSADQVAAFFREHTTMIRFSMITYDLFGVLLVPFFALIVVQMKRMATPSHVFAYSYLSVVATGATLFAIADLCWLVAAFRPDRSPELVQLLNDLAWIIFTAGRSACSLPPTSSWRWPSISMPTGPDFPPMDRALQHRHRRSGGAGGMRRRGPDRPAGLERCHFLLAEDRAFAIFLVVMFIALRTAINRQALEERGLVSGVSLQETPTAAPVDPNLYRRDSKTDQWICWWSMPVFYTLFGMIFVVLARVMPPPRPDVTTAQIVGFFHEHALTIKIGFVLLLIVIGFSTWANGLVAHT